MLVLQYLLGSDFVVLSIVSESRQYVCREAFRQFSPARVSCLSLTVSFLSMVVVVMVGVVVIAERKHGTLEKHT